MRNAAIIAHVLWLLLLGCDGNRILAHLRERVAVRA